MAALILQQLAITIYDILMAVNNRIVVCSICEVDSLYLFLSIDMGCVGGTATGGKPKVTKTTKFSSLQLQLLNMMYSNLSKRCRNNILTREVFDIFFHSSGLIGQIIFLKFNSKNSGIITFEQFMQAFEIMIKGSMREKADVLFDIYDIQKSGGVNFSELLKILFSYPLEELNKMFIEEPFLKYIGENQLAYYFGPQHKKIQQKNIIEEESEEQQKSNVKKKRGQYVPASEVFRVETNPKPQKKEPFNPKKEFSNMNKTNSNNQKVKKGVQSSVLTIQSFKKNRKNPKIQSNVASLTKKYANFLFISYNLNKQKDEFSKQHFFALIQEHPAIFNVYLSGFHTYIWQVDNGEPQYLKITPYIQCYAKQVYQDKSQKVYLKFIKTTVFVFEHMRAKIPIDIINLEGLNVVQISTRGEYGIIFKHRDGLYPPKEYYFQQQQTQEQWLKQTMEFRENSILDQFVRLERIGGGNFSSVYRGKDKNTNKEVAIKVIEHFKLSSDERQVIKRQCGILRNCHHPNIIKFIGEFKTKSSLYIVTQLMNEGDLFDYTKKNGFLEEYEAAIIFRQLVDTVIYVNNELGIIHRDLKPQNVMIMMNDEKKLVKKIKLIDFGFAVYKDKLNQLPLREKFAGTPGFIAPEIYKQQNYDEKIDIFSLGIILYFMLSGKLPFQSDFLQQIQDMTKNCNFSLVNVHWSNISDDAKDLIHKTLTFKENRISASEIAKHPWLQKIEDLKQYNGRNKKPKIL